MKITSKIGHVAVLSVNSRRILDGKIIRIGSSEIRQAGRSTQGVRLVRTDEGALVASAGGLPDSDVVVVEGDGQGDLPSSNVSLACEIKRLPCECGAFWLWLEDAGHHLNR